jgi:hypothetical protein
MTRRVRTIVTVLLLAGCSGAVRVGSDEPSGRSGPPSGQESPPWEIVYVKSTSIDVGGCATFENMRKEAHLTPRGVTVYVETWTGSAGDSVPEDVEQKLVRSVPPGEEPARTLIATIDTEGHHALTEHATYSVGEPATGCSTVSESITVLTPSTTAIFTFEHGGGTAAPPPRVQALYDLVTAHL